MPIAKLWEDRKTVLKYVLSGHPKIMFGSDSAPHEVAKKENACWCAWIFTAPIALQALIEIFESFGQLDNLHKFVSENAKETYETDLPQKNVKFIKKDFEIPDKNKLPHDYFVNPNSRKELITPAKLFMWWKKLAWNLKWKNLPWSI